MLDKLGFDHWADYYEKTVSEAEVSNRYPFAGYDKMLEAICESITSNQTILDIGVGTGTLAKRLYDAGNAITAFDFSPKMVDAAKEKMPNAHIFEWDLAKGMPSAQLDTQFDAITCTYVLHHFTDQEKITLIENMLKHLTPSGHLYIGDISFTTEEHLETCKLAHINSWDHDEFYFVENTIRTLLAEQYNVQYEQISHCGGLYIVSLK
ncbi:class I SAM-dependent DNA methyltransferase [Metasolibacillus meyeri]|uniref:class I SAM-dependent DNA methyltransferase n=1 Tax=Metasolibacillus meyeri TaxID=1071052 RepID=UPI000D327CC4|nr:class I SAM-dependent methyltransferase [Metasolibacillus meyeri]